MKYTRYIAFFAFVAIFYLVLNNVDPARAVQAGKWVELSPPMKLPPETYLAEGDKRIALADFAGKKVLLNLWATWCTPCLKELPTLDALQKSRADIVVIPLSIDTVTFAQLRGFADKRGFVVSNLGLDDTGAIYKQLTAKGLPLTYLINSKGEITHRYIGATDWMNDSHAALIDAAE